MMIGVKEYRIAPNFSSKYQSESEKLALIAGLHAEMCMDSSSSVASFRSGLKSTQNIIYNVPTGLWRSIDLKLWWQRNHWPLTLLCIYNNFFFQAAGVKMFWETCQSPSGPHPWRYNATTVTYFRPLCLHTDLLANIEYTADWNILFRLGCIMSTILLSKC